MSHVFFRGMQDVLSISSLLMAYGYLGRSAWLHIPATGVCYIGVSRVRSTVLTGQFSTISPVNTHRDPKLPSYSPRYPWDC